MSVTVTISEAKKRLEELLAEARAEQDEVIIAEQGVPLARLVPVPPTGRRKPGSAKGKIWMAEDFDAPLPEEVLESFGL